nr:hypothetical protein [uncultured Sphingomonas sp.]
MTTYSVQVHAFGFDPESRDLTNPDICYVDQYEEPHRVKGWSTYCRTESDEGGTFEIVETHDTATRDSALAVAGVLARKWGTTDIQEY